MTKKNKIIAVVAIVAILIIGVGYAAIQNITLNINGTAKADPSQANFNVKFSGTPTVSAEDNVTASITDDLNAVMNVSGLTTKGEKVTATYTIQNVSGDLSAELSATVSNSNSEYFKVSQVIDKTTLTKGEATTITVTVELIKTPIQEKVTSTIGVQIVAEPVQPA